MRDFNYCINIGNVFGSLQWYCLLCPFSYTNHCDKKLACRGGKKPYLIKSQRLSQNFQVMMMVATWIRKTFPTILGACFFFPTEVSFASFS